MNRKIFPDGLQRFLFQLNLFEGMLRKAKSSTNPENYLYENGTRNILFRLEALCRIYKSTVDKKHFEDFRIFLKSLEDVLGEIDYYDGYLKEFSAAGNIPVSILNYLKRKKQDAFSNFRNYISEYKLFDDKKSDLIKIKIEVSAFKWKKREKERKKLIKFLIKKINKFSKNYAKGKTNFNELENGVHKFRRELRWFSIYFAVLDGLVQLKKIKVPDESLKKYMTHEILNSPFNKFPKPSKSMRPVYIQAPSYFALSWMIHELGIIKDDGLKDLLLHESIRNSGIKSKLTIEKVKETILSKSKYKLKQIPETVEHLSDEFMFRDRIPERLKMDFARALQE